MRRIGYNAREDYKKSSKSVAAAFQKAHDRSNQQPARQKWLRPFWVIMMRRSEEIVSTLLAMKAKNRWSSIATYLRIAA